MVLNGNTKLVFITTLKNTFHAFILQFPVHSVPFKLQTVLTEELEFTSHNKSNSSTSSITTCHVFMSMLNAAPTQLLSCFCHLSIRANTTLLPTRHLFVSVWRSPAHFIKTTLSVCSYPQLSINVTDLKTEYSICHYSELGIIQSSPINLFLAVRISLI